MMIALSCRSPSSASGKEPVPEFPDAFIDQQSGETMHTRNFDADVVNA
jgi:hypothetical protein